MSTHISGQATTAREQARQGDGTFGQQQYTRAHGVDLDDGIDHVDTLEWPDGFDAHTAEPTEFDSQLQVEHQALAGAHARLETARTQIHSLAHGGRASRGLKPGEELSDELAVAEAIRLSATLGTPSEERKAPKAGRLMNERTDATLAIATARERIDALNDVYRNRGAWNRAFLVANANGHVHSSTDCSTCRPTTQYAWMTNYSGADEDTIVQDAGYRACTTCYPSAPLGDQRTLPTKMLTDEEENAAAQREQAQATREAKQTQAASNAPTTAGEPIEIRYPSGKQTYVETLKTERSAQQWATNHLIDDAETQALAETPNIDREKQRIEREAAQRVLDALAEKRGVDRTEVAEEIRGKALAKAKRDHKASLKHLRALNLPIDEDAEPRHERTLEAITNAWT